MSTGSWPWKARPRRRVPYNHAPERSGWASPVNEENLRKLYQRLGISESSPSPAPPPLPAPAIVADPTGEGAPPPSPPPAPDAAPSPLERLVETRVTLSLPVLALAFGALAAGLILILRHDGGASSAPPPPTVQAPPPLPRFIEPPVTPPIPVPEPVKPPAPPVVQPPAPAPMPPPPPELTPAEKRAAKLRKNGATDASEAAVARALDWLVRHQAGTGEWEAMHFERRCPMTASCQVKEAAGDPLYTPGVTGLALIAFMGAGHSPAEGPYAKVISLGLAWLAEHQDSEGGITHDRRVLFYNQAVATRALCEAAGMTKDNRFRAAAQKALNYLGKNQQADGGWNYYHDPAEQPRNDASIAGWAALAIRAGEEAGLIIPTDTKARIRDLLVRRTVAETGEVIYADRDPGAGRRGAGLTALGLLIRGRSGDDDPAISSRAVARILASRPDWNQFLAAQEKSGRREITFSPDFNMASWYYGTEALYRWGGADWTKWNDAARETLVQNQIRDGHSGGSWPPELSYIGREGGRVFSTAISVMMLSIYSRDR